MCSGQPVAPALSAGVEAAVYPAEGAQQACVGADWASSETMDSPPSI